MSEDEEVRVLGEGSVRLQPESHLGNGGDTTGKQVRTGLKTRI